jgi:hypothetical protein
MDVWATPLASAGSGVSTLRAPVESLEYECYYPCHHQQEAPKLLVANNYDTIELL